MACSVAARSLGHSQSYHRLSEVGAVYVRDAQLSGCPCGIYDGDHARGVDTAPARRFVSGIDVRAILKRQPVDADHMVNRRINSKSDNQV